MPGSGHEGCYKLPAWRTRDVLPSWSAWIRTTKKEYNRPLIFENKNETNLAFSALGVSYSRNALYDYNYTLPTYFTYVGQMLQLNNNQTFVRLLCAMCQTGQK